MSKNSIILLDLFYPRKRPHFWKKWEKRYYKKNGRVFYLKQTHFIKNNIEKRIQIFREGNYKNRIIKYRRYINKVKIVTYRRYINKNEIVSLLEKTGFNNIMITDNYDFEKFHNYVMNELTASNFVVKAKKKNLI